ncbi:MULTISPECIES: DUF3016 domain-containing protein [Ramlibacter]|nr:MULTISPECIES: DUF3016 domain-containing protein [Ramlibacter]MBA2961924.1 DUF3016 domain-containing protein [Ramlibacter sp. CGMCC 1.13660]
MRTERIVLVGLGLLMAGVLAHAGEVSVTFFEPEKSTDGSSITPYATQKSRAEVQRELERHLQRLGRRHLAADESLAVEVGDVDLAGRYEPFRFRGSVRVVRDITWPRMGVRYTLSRAGQVVATGQEQVSDMNYLWTGQRYSGTDPFRYEKAMLDDWFEKRFAAKP